MKTDNHGKNHLMILGTRGIPARHGGFETFAEKLALFLVGRNWDVTVYCQAPKNARHEQSEWEGVQLVHIPAGDDGALSTIIFDFRATRHAAGQKGLILTLGYNTAIFLAWLKLRGIRNLINMDGIEWRRSKWSFPARIWLYCNEWLAGWFASHLVADNPAIKTHLLRHVAHEHITMIPYGSTSITSADENLLAKLDLLPNQYVLVVARSEPENSILEIVQAFCVRRRGIKLVILGKYFPEHVRYHRQVIDACNEDVVLAGAIYDATILCALRFHARLYVHGHQVGGTNPSLVEALGAGNAVLVHDNEFNRWVVGQAGLFFSDVRSCIRQFDLLLDDVARLETLRAASRARHREQFQWEAVLQEYESMLTHWYPSTTAASVSVQPTIRT